MQRDDTGGDQAQSAPRVFLNSQRHSQVAPGNHCIVYICVFVQSASNLLQNVEQCSFLFEIFLEQYVESLLCVATAGGYRCRLRRIQKKKTVPNYFASRSNLCICVFCPVDVQFIARCGATQRSTSYHIAFCLFGSSSYHLRMVSDQFWRAYFADGQTG